MLHRDTNAKSSTQRQVDRKTVVAPIAAPPSVFKPYISERLEVRPQPDKGGLGVFAKVGLEQGELLVIWGGEVVDQTGLATLTAQQRQVTIQIEDNAYLVSYDVTDGDYVNHSCDPNARLADARTLIALRAIPAGDEVCFDYATCDADNYDEFQCSCGAASCRGRISGLDWQEQGLQIKYTGMFSPYLQRRISALNK